MNSRSLITRWVLQILNLSSILVSCC